MTLKELFIGASVLASFVPTLAHAVTVEQADIQTSAGNATIDYWFINLDDAGTLSVSASPIPFNVDVITVENMSLLLFNEDGAGGIGSFIAADGAPMGQSASITEVLAAGDYVAVISAFELTMDEVGLPFQTDSTVPIPIDYEIGLSFTMTQGLETITCVIEGNLDGSFTQTPRNVDPPADCQIPIVSVSEAPVLSVFGFGLLALLGRAVSKR
ncbi:MAG: hypothetical protein AAGJ09_05095 [Pseudomonadota bacterium]